MIDHRVLPNCVHPGRMVSHNSGLGHRFGYDPVCGARVRLFSPLLLLPTSGRRLPGEVKLHHFPNNFLNPLAFSSHVVIMVSYLVQ